MTSLILKLDSRFLNQLEKMALILANIGTQHKISLVVFRISESEVISQNHQS